MWHRYIGFWIVLAALLVGCGGQPAVSPVSASPPDALAATAWTAITQRDEMALTRMFDSSVEELLAGNYAGSAVDSYGRMQSELGIVTSSTQEPLTSRGDVTVVPYLVSYEQGTSRWQFLLVQNHSDWKLLKIEREILTRP